MHKYKKIVFPISSVIGAIIIGMILLLISGDPLAFKKIRDLLIGNFQSSASFLNFLGYFSVYALVGISVAISFRGGLFNIGVSGQMMFSGVVSFIVIAWGNTTLNPFVIFLICVLAASFIGAITILLKIYGRIHEVVSTIMLNWAILYFYQFIQSMAPQTFMDTNGASLIFANNLLINITMPGIVASFFNWGILIVGISILAFWFLFRFTKLGFNINNTGINEFAVKYVGLKSNRIMIYTMLMSSFVAGLAGFVYYFGIAKYLPVQTIPIVLGFDGITIALLASNSFIGIIFSAMFVSGFFTQKIFMSGDKEIVDIMVSIALLAIALASYYLSKPKVKLKEWSLQLYGLREEQLTYSLTGFNRAWLKFLRIKDKIALESRYFNNKINIRYNFYEAQIINWLTFIFKGNRLRYLAYKTIIRTEYEKQWIDYWKDYEKVTHLELEFNKKFVTNNPEVNQQKVTAALSKEKAIKKAVEKISKRKTQEINHMIADNIKIIKNIYEKKQKEKVLLLKQISQELKDRKKVRSNFKNYEVKINKIKNQQEKATSNFEAQILLVKEKTKEMA